MVKYDDVSCLLRRTQAEELMYLASVLEKRKFDQVGTRNAMLCGSLSN